MKTKIERLALCILASCVLSACSSGKTSLKQYHEQLNRTLIEVERLGKMTLPSADDRRPPIACACVIKPKPNKARPIPPPPPPPMELEVLDRGISVLQRAHGELAAGRQIIVVPQEEK